MKAQRHSGTKAQRLKLWLRGLALACGVVVLSAGAWGQTLPKGHPPLEGMMGGHEGHGHGAMGGAATRPAVKGSLTIQLVQGSKDGPALGKEKLTVELYHQQVKVSAHTLETDEKGAAVLRDIPLRMPVEPLITLQHGGVVQQKLGAMLTAEAANGAVTMKVYEVTDKKPGLSLSMRHVLVRADESGAQVIEMVEILSDSDRIWLGEMRQDKRVSLVLALPPGARNIQLPPMSGDEAPQAVGGNIVVRDAIYPGRNRPPVQFAYQLEAKGGAITVPIVAALPTKRLMVIAPAEKAKVTAEGLAGGETMPGEGGRNQKMFHASDLAADAAASLTIVPVVPVQKRALSPKNIALGGALVAVLLAGAVIVLKSRKKTEKAS